MVELVKLQVRYVMKLHTQAETLKAEGGDRAEPHGLQKWSVRLRM